MTIKWRLMSYMAFVLTVCAILIGVVSSAGSYEHSAAAETAASGAPAEEAFSSVHDAAPAQPVSSLPTEWNIPGMQPMVQNDYLILYFQPDTTEIAVRDKRSGTVWYSNPANRDQDTKATAFNKDRLSSQLTITYYNSAGQVFTFNNYADSIQNKQFEMKRLDDGVKIIYTFGDQSKGIEAVPKRVSKERFEKKILSKLSSSDQNQIKKRFKFLKKENVYERWDVTLTELTLNRVIDILAKAGYTEEDLAFDNKENQVTADAGKAKAAFTVPLEYRLDGDNLLVTLPANEIKQPPSYPINSISVLDFFGAADQYQQGYMLVPDGSGSLIYLNSGKLSQEAYSAPVYGLDHAINLKENVQHSEATRLPVFGMKQGDQAFVGIIEKGDALANIEADIAGRLNSYNSVYSSFTTITKDEMTLTGGWRVQSIPIFQANMYQGDISIRYGFLKDNEANYAGMAKYYQDYLVKNYSLERLGEQEDLPFFLDLIGSIPKQKSFLGIPYDAMEPLTTFSEAETILEALKKSGIDSIKLRYIGWFNGGMNHTIPTKVKPDAELGGKKGFQRLAEYAKQNHIDFYPDVAFQRVYHDTWGFKPSRDAAREISRNPAKLYRYSPASFLRNFESSPAYILSPKKLPDYVDAFAKSYAPYGIGGLSLRDLAETLDSDFRTSDVIDRQQAAGIVKRQMKKLSAQFKDTLVIGGNAMALPYAKNVLEAPMSSSGFNLTDESVPFYQMVVHGYADYAGKPVNLSEDQNSRVNLLKALENGSDVYFQWIYKDASNVKETEFDDLYSSQYRQWIEEARAMYNEVNRVLKDVRMLRMTGHEKLADNVYRTTYENGKTITVNYNKRAVTVDGVTIDAESYRAGGDNL